jgi:hypothetical protein
MFPPGLVNAVRALSVSGWVLRVINARRRHGETSATSPVHAAATEPAEELPGGAHAMVMIPQGIGQALHAGSVARATLASRAAPSMSR